jgi:hypothetical protein
VASKCYYIDPGTIQNSSIEVVIRAFWSMGWNGKKIYWPILLRSVAASVGCFGVTLPRKLMVQGFQAVTEWSLQESWKKTHWLKYRLAAWYTMNS